MALDNLREFIKAIDGIGELARVTHPVRAKLEIAEIADRLVDCILQCARARVHRRFRRDARTRHRR